MARKDHLNHKPTKEGIAVIETIKSHVMALDDAIITQLPDSRDKSMALTKLEECRMWAVKAAVFAHPEKVDEIHPQERYLSHVDGAGPVDGQASS